MNLHRLVGEAIQDHIHDRPDWMIDDLADAIVEALRRGDIRTADADVHSDACWSTECPCYRDGLAASFEMAEDVPKRPKPPNLKPPSLETTAQIWHLLRIWC